MYNTGCMLCTFLLLLVYCECEAQYPGSPQMDSAYDYSSVQFIREASSHLFTWVEQKNYDTLHLFAANWNKSEFNNNELTLAISTLLAIETEKLDELRLSGDLFDQLSDYAKELNTARQQPIKFKYYIRLPYRKTYDATADAKKILGITAEWASRLIKDNDLDNSARFLCAVFAGQITDPEKFYRTNASQYTIIQNHLQVLAKNNEAYLIARRNRRTGTAAVSVGVWVPTGHLSRLGPHPEVGLQLGIRSKLNEYDMIYNFRFLHPTPQPYTFLRDSILYTTHYYDGGYIGFDYTHYFRSPDAI